MNSKLYFCCLVIFLLSIPDLFAQSIPKSFLNSGPQIENEEEVLSEINRLSSVQNNSRSRFIQTTINYDLVDNLYALDFGFTYDRAVSRVNYRYSPDTFLNYRWVVQVFDTLIDIQPDPTFPFTFYDYSTSRVFIDTLGITYGHVNTSGTPDTVVVSIVDGDNLFTLEADRGAIDGNNLLWSDTIITDSSLTGLGPGGGVLLDVALLTPDLQLNQGQRFAVQIDYFGSENDPFFVLHGFRDECNANCVAEPSIVPSRFPGGSTFSRFVGFSMETFSTSIFFDCDGDTAQTPGSCEVLPLQNLVVVPVITAEVEITGLADNKVASEVMVYPNPAVEQIQIRTDHSIESIQIYSMLGELVYDQDEIEKDGNFLKIDVNDLIPGFYFVNMESEGQIISKKVEIVSSN